MKNILLTLLTILTLSFTGCGGDYTTVYPEVNTVEGVTLALVEDSLKPGRATFILTNASDTDVVYDPVEFHLEELKKDVWQESVGTRESHWKRDTTEPLPAGASVELGINWKGLCGSLLSGEHRMIVIVNDQPVACEFEK